MTDLLQPLVAALADSDLVRAARVVRDAESLAGVRPLREAEIRELVANGNTAEGWHHVRVADGFRPARVRHCDFRGDVVLGRFDGTARGPGGEELPSGVYRSAVSNCVIGSDALVRNVGLLAGYVVEAGACVSDCGRVVCGPTTFGTGGSVTVGPQTGGRWLRPFAEITLDLAAALTDPRAADLAARYEELLADYLARVRSARGVIGAGAVVAHVPVVRNAYVGPAAELDAATRVENAALLSSPDEPVRVRDGACVVDSVLQWGTRVTGPAVVERAVLLEHAEVGRLGRVTDSLIGPNSAIAGGEVTASLVGPFVGLQHQGLLIAARWPGGRGNVGYGAGVGCNHTSRAPDQEAVLGEGLFVGLGAKVQYPLDLGRSPYSVVACGVVLPPQKVAFPFSLIRPAEGGGPNVLVPAWVLSDNLYAVQRGMHKFEKRDRATRHRLARAAFRPEVMALVEDAKRRLEAVGGRDSYTEADVPGLGRNVLLERHRVAAVRCYADHLERVRLAGQLRHGDIGRDGLLRLAELMEKFGAAVERSKARDDERGAAVIDDYAAAHPPAADDAVVAQTWDEVRAVQAQVARALAGRKAVLSTES